MPNKALKDFTDDIKVRVVLNQEDYKGAQVKLKAIEVLGKDACDADTRHSYTGNTQEILIQALWESGASDV